MSDREVSIISAPARYLPEDKFGQIETRLQNDGQIGRILTSDMLANADSAIQNLVPAIDDAIKTTTRRLNVEIPIYFCVLNRDDFNARADWLDGWACITINSLTLQSLQEFAVKLGFSKLFSAEGEPQRGGEKLGAPKARSEIFLAVLMAERTELPDDQMLVLLIAQTAAWFLAAHELGHIINGHVRILRNSAAAISERLLLENGDDYLFVRTLEFDADVFALQHTMIRHFELVGRSTPPFDIMHSVERACDVVLTSAYTLMALSEAFAPSNIDYERATHPPAIFRAWHVNAAMHVHIERWSREGVPLPSDAGLSLRRAIVRVEGAAAELAGHAINFRLYGAGLRKIVKHDRDVLRKWSEIRPALERVKFGSHKLAPAQFDADGRYIGPDKDISDAEIELMLRRLGI